MCSCSIHEYDKIWVYSLWQKKKKIVKTQKWNSTHLHTYQCYQTFLTLQHLVQLRSHFFYAKPVHLIQFNIHHEDVSLLATKWRHKSIHHRSINLNVHWLHVLEKVEPGSTFTLCFLAGCSTVAWLFVEHYFKQIFSCGSFTMCYCTHNCSLKLLFFFTVVVCFNESQSRGDSKFIHFQPQNEEVTEALVKSIAISLCPFRLDCGEYLETQSRAGLMTFWLLSTQSYVKWDRRMDPSSQWLAKWLQRLSSTDNTVFESPVRGWRGREWRV